jgi:hypothetical protein
VTFSSMSMVWTMILTCVPFLFYLFYYYFFCLVGLATTKVNKKKSKRLVEQGGAVVVNLSKKRKNKAALKQVVDEFEIRLSTPLDVAPSTFIPTRSVEIVEPISLPSSSKGPESIPTLRHDASLAMRHAKSVVAKEDVKEYSKMNTNGVKKFLVNSLVKVSEIIPSVIFCFALPFHFTMLIVFCLVV